VNDPSGGQFEKDRVKKGISLFGVSLTPGFSPAGGRQAEPSRFNGLARGKTIETVLVPFLARHPAKAGC
jgi:hypothetical protein